MVFTSDHTFRRGMKKHVLYLRETVLSKCDKLLFSRSTCVHSNRQQAFQSSNNKTCLFGILVCLLFHFFPFLVWNDSLRGNKTSDWKQSAFVSPEEHLSVLPLKSYTCCPLSEKTCCWSHSGPQNSALLFWSSAESSVNMKHWLIANQTLAVKIHQRLSPILTILNNKYGEIWNTDESHLSFKDTMYEKWILKKETYNYFWCKIIII